MEMDENKEKTQGNNVVTVENKSFKPEFDISMTYNMDNLNRQETENLIVDLYYNQKKTFREIQQIVRKSSRDIKAILDKVDPGRSSLPPSSQAYKLFSEGKSPGQVAITLNLREPEVTQLHREYWRLNQLHNLDQVYEETKGNFLPLIELYRQVKTAGMNIAHVIRLLSLTNNDIQAIEYRCQELRREAVSLEVCNGNAAKTLEQLSYAISETQNALDHYESQRKQQRFEMDRLFDQKTQLEEFVECFKNNNGEYVKVKENIKQEIENNLTNPKRLLRLALLALIVSLRKDPNKFQLLYYQILTEATTTLTSPSQVSTPSYDSLNRTVSYMNEQCLSQGYNPTDDFQNLVLEETETLYDILVEDSINKINNIALLKLAK